MNQADETNTSNDNGSNSLIDNKAAKAYENKVNSTFKEIENSKIGKAIPLSINSITTRDLELLTLGLKLLFILPILLIMHNTYKIFYYLILLFIFIDASLGIVQYLRILINFSSFLILTSSIKVGCFYIYSLKSVLTDSSRKLIFILSTAFSCIILLNDCLNFFYLRYEIANDKREVAETEEINV